MDPDLQRRLRRISARQNNLERRLLRIENSIIFRFLRWLGPKLAAFGLPVPGGLQVDEADAYQVWVQETALYHVSLAVSLAQPSLAEPERRPTISVILDAGQSGAAALERALASLRAQTYQALELFVCDDQNPVSSVLPKIRGETILWTDSSVVLEPDALAAFAGAFGQNAAAIDTAAVYSDWDHIDPDGRRHSPRFTPEFSPELLRQTPYWGVCYLTAAGHSREMPWSEVARESVRRVPRMLWHSQAPATMPSNASAGEAASSARASIIICSRNPGRLARCLKALGPTLDPRHEIVVVAHNADLAVSDGVKVVRYDGAFHFGVMNARGVQESTGDVLCFLNDDVFPSTSDWLERMLAQAVRPEIGVVGALLLYPDGSIQHAGVVVDRWHPAHIGRFQKESYFWRWLRLTRDVSAVTGACMAMRRSTWNELGGFDRRFPVNYNDIDLCLRAAARGYRVLIETRAVLVHEESRTRLAVVQPEEAERFHERWSPVTDRPDPYFNPQLGSEDETIALPAPWTAFR